MIDYIPESAYVYVVEEEDLNYPEVTGYYPSTMPYGNVGSPNGYWREMLPADAEKLPIYSDSYTMFITQAIYSSIEGSGANRRGTIDVYYYGYYTTDYNYNNEGTDCQIHLLQVLGMGKYTFDNRNSTHSYNVDTVYSRSDVYTMGYRYYYCPDGNTLTFLTEAQLKANNSDLSYDDIPLVLYPYYMDGNSILFLLYNMGVFLSDVGDIVVSLLNSKIGGLTFLELLLGSGFLVYASWCIVKFVIPT